jgi:hypothetical protein
MQLFYPKNCKSNLYSPNQATAMKPACQNNQKEFAAAVQAAHNNYEATTPDNVKALANQVVDAISAISF